ncbi:flavin monoamine oxidase family protein [Oleiharenicola lentus]|uniref:flavin monoamine oxidase family protein n=1 Tax=Oleiharenicola lentus TaxID=2508720 RepID=UPI003F66D21F
MKTPSAFARRAFVGLSVLLLGLTGCTGPAVRTPERVVTAEAPVPDVIVVGAGLAGLTTAKDLIRAGKTVLVLEATDRIGGRAHTDKTFGAGVENGAQKWLHGIDLGAGWIHGADHNPLRALVDEMGFTRTPSKLDGAVFVGNHRLTPEEKAAFHAALGQTEEAMEKARHAGLDLAASEFLPKSSAYRYLVGANIGPLESGSDIAKTSSVDAVAMDTDPDDFVREGIGNLVTRYGRDVPVQLNSPVTAIRYGSAAAGSEVVVETANGKYRGRRVVVTVSTGVLAARRIAFAPELPEWKWDAIRGLPMGLLNKIIFRFDGEVLPNEPVSEWVLHQQSPPPETGEPEVMAFVVKPLGSNLIVGFFGGSQAHRFEKLGDKAAADYAKAALAQMYGPELVARIRNDETKATHWGQNPWTLGAYSAALPGASKMHEELAKPVDGLVFFAGEAAGPVEFNGSLAAAYVSGLQASRAVQLSLADTPVTTPAPKREPVAARR